MRISFKTGLKALLLIIWQLTSFYGSAQITNLRFESFVMPDEKQIDASGGSYEDSRGFMWFGGLTGLYLFDGYKLTHFQNDPEDSLSISDNKVRLIKEDQKGNLWIGTQNGLNYFDMKKRVFKRYNDKAKLGIGFESVNAIEQDKNKNLWITTNFGVFKSDSNYLKFEDCTPKLENSDFGALKVAESGIYFNTYSFKHNVFTINLFYKDFKNDSLFLIKPIKKNPSLGNLDDEGIIWLVNEKGISYIDTKTDKTKVIDYSYFQNEAIWVFLRKNKQEFWILQDKKISQLTYKTGAVKTFKYNPLFPNGYPKTPLNFALFSSNNILWGFTERVGILIDVFNKHKFQNMPYNIIETLDNMLCLYEIYEYSPDVLLIRTKNGTGLLNINSGEVKPFNYKPTYNLEGWKTGINCFFEEKDDKNKVWLSTVNGLFLFDKLTKKFINLESEIKEFDIFRKPFVNIRDLYKDTKGYLWIATWGNGLYKVDFKKKKIFSYLQEGMLGATRTIMESQNGQIWVGTRNGLCKYITEADSFKVYRNILNDPESLSENTAFAIYEDAKGDIWVGTYGGGLNKMDIKTGKFIHFTTKDGLLNNNVVSIMPDKKGNLWMSTFEGISVFNPTTQRFQNFTHQNGLLNKIYNAFTFGKGIYSDRFFYSGNEGFDFFYPDSIQLSTFDPNIYITDFKLFNKTVSTKGGNKDAKTFYLDENISFTKQLTLKYEQNVIGFDFTALDYSSPKTIQYAYQLQGFDTTWQYIGNQRSATFTNLDPGNYTFKVKATNGDGVWGTKMATLKLTILAPWWQTWWFRSLVFLTLFGLAYAFYNYRIRQIKEKETIKTALNQRISEVEMEALRSQMSPHFIFNCLSAITRFILNHENEAATLYLTKFSRLVRLVLNHSQVEMIPLSKELDAIKLYLDMESLRFHEKFKYTINVDKKLDADKINIPPMLIQPYLENAVWHGLLPRQSEYNQLTLDLTNGNESLTITIEDNGIGRDKAAENKSKTALTNDHKSFGMKLTEERIDMINKMNIGSANVQIIDLKNENSEATGTKVVLVIPIKLIN